MNWNNETEIERFRQMWAGRPSCRLDHSGAAWNERAIKWEEGLRSDAARKKRNAARVADVTSFLLEKEALKENYDVIDIGCGPGRFVAEFARHARPAVGTDLSENMCRFGREYCQSQGIGNVSFIPCDFKAVQPEDMGWEKAFDLVFSCTTPAMNTMDSIEKTIKMSRRWCLNGNFVNMVDGLLQDAAANVEGACYVPRWNGHSSYAMFNILWLSGYSPYISYYHEGEDEIYLPNEDTAREAARNLNVPGGDEDALCGRILDYLKKVYDEKGSIVYPFKCTYAWVLWDVNERFDRSGYNMTYGEGSAAPDFSDRKCRQS